MSLCDGSLVLIKLSAGVEQLLSSLVWWAPSASVLSPYCTAGQAGGEREVFTTAVDSPVYCTQHPSLDTNLQAWTTKILGDIIKFQCACVRVCHYCVSLCSLWQSPTHQRCAVMCVLVQTQSRPHNMAAQKTGTNNVLNKHNGSHIVNSELILLYSLACVRVCVCMCEADAEGSAVRGIMIREVFITVLPRLFPPPQSS